MRTKPLSPYLVRHLTNGHPCPRAAAAQEDCLRVAVPQPVEHPLIARYFERFSESDRRYVPSIMLRAGPWSV